jgi:hypothetical protein
MEIWKDIKGFEGKYRISSYGNVWSITKGLRNINPGMSGYLSVSLWKNNKRVNTSIHRLVAEHFIDNPNNLPLVDHINNVRHDNNVSNLRWVDYVSNSLNMKRNTNYSVKDYIEYTEEELKNEVWVDATKIIDELTTKEFFMVSNLGRYKYYKRNNRWGTKSVQTISPKHTVGYPSTTIRGEGFKINFPIHKLVALCFLRRPNEGEVIDHIDSNVNNPRLSNLQIITVKENNIKANKKNDKGVNNGMSKHNVDNILEVLHLFYFNKKSKKEIGRLIDMGINTVTSIVTGKTYKNIYNDFISKNPILPERPTQSELQSIARKGVVQQKLTCPHCNKIGGNTNMVRYHFNNCKKNN